MARYQLVKDEDLNIIGVRVNDSTHPELPEGTSIPNSLDNRHWVEYEEWAQSNTADAADTIDYMAMMRSERDQRLAACDWNQSRDVTLTNDAAWVTYRQALRDMPQNNSSVSDKAAYEALTWPTEPQG